MRYNLACLAAAAALGAPALAQSPSAQSTIKDDCGAGVVQAIALGGVDVSGAQNNENAVFFLMNFTIKKPDSHCSSLNGSNWFYLDTDTSSHEIEPSWRFSLLNSAMIARAPVAIGKTASAPSAKVFYVTLASNRSVLARKMGVDLPVGTTGE